MKGARSTSSDRDLSGLGWDRGPKNVRLSHPPVAVPCPVGRGPSLVGLQVTRDAVYMYCPMLVLWDLAREGVLTYFSFTLLARDLAALAACSSTFLV